MMASVERTETYSVPADKIKAVLTDYESYPDFMDGVDETVVLERGEGTAKVEYSLNVIKKLTYILNMKETENQVIWDFESGDIFKKNSGSWTIKDLGNGSTELSYQLEVEAKLMVPKMVTNKLVKHNLPALMNSVYERAKSL